MSETTTKTDTAAKGKKLNVQVPGETTTKTDTADDQASNPGAKPEVQPEPAPRAGRNYRDMHAHEIDPATLSAPVLTKDGYLCPTK